MTESIRSKSRRATGPVTPEGKAISSQNARKHGLCAQTVLLPGESRTEYQALRDAHFREFEPKGLVENRLVREMVDAEWRLTRVRRAEGEIFSRHRSLSDALLQDAGPLKLLQRYETQFRRQYDRSLELLLDLRRRAGEDVKAAERKEDLEFREAIREIALAPTPGELRDLRNELGPAGPGRPRTSLYGLEEGPSPGQTT